jgi:uncharacterized membrane protein
MTRSEELSQKLAELMKPQSKTPDGMTVQGMVEDWFNPKPMVMRHVIVIQLIAACIVAMILLATSASSFNPEEMLVAIFSFLLFIALAVGLFSKL